MSYSWLIEECILASYDKKCVTCPVHGDISLAQVAPDTVNRIQRVIFLPVIRRTNTLADGIENSISAIFRLGGEILDQTATHHSR